MAQEKETVTITISIDRDVKDLLERYANEVDITVSRLARNLMTEAFRHFKIFDKLHLGNQMLTINADNFRNSMTAYAEKKLKDEKPVFERGEEKVQVSIVIEKEAKEIMANYAKSLDIPLKLFAANMLYIGLNDLKLLHNIGIARLAISFEKFVKAFEDFKAGKRKQNKE